MYDKSTVSQITYFNAPGPENTAAVIKAAVARAEERGIKEIVVATQSGDTALKTAAAFPGKKIIAVSYHSGSKEPFDDLLPASARRELEDKGVKVLTCSHALSGAERAIDKEGGWAPLNLVAQTLRIFGQGTKVCVEIVLMAADAALLSGSDLIALAGSGRGADTALLISPANQNRIFDLRVKEIICKPDDF